MISVLLIPEYYSPVNWVNNIYVYPDVQALYITISSPITGHWPLLQWRGNERDDVSNHQAHDCLLNRLFTGQGYLPFGVRPAIGGRPPIEVRCTSIEVHLNYLNRGYRYGARGPGGVLPIWWVIHMCRGFDPLFWPSGCQTRSFWGVFSHPPTQKRSFGYKSSQNRSFWPQNTIFPSIFLGPIFSGPRHTPSNFRTEYPPPPPPPPPPPQTKLLHLQQCGEKYL